MKTIVVLPAFNCEHTLFETLSDIPQGIIDEVVLVDDCSTDATITKAQKYGIKHIVKHSQNLGYGANQKTCYETASNLGADVIIMLHPDYQYDPKLITNIVDIFKKGADVVFASRMMHGREAIKNGMPIYKFYANRILTVFQNIVFNRKLSEYHTGYRAYRTDILNSINYKALSNGFIFDNQLILELFRQNVSIEEIYCPARYLKDSSSIGFMNSIKYGIEVVYYTIKYRFKV